MSSIIQKHPINEALVKLAKSSDVTSGDLKKAAENIAKEGCLALNVTRIGIWQLNYEKCQLENIVSYNSEEDKFGIQGPFSLVDRENYIERLNTERILRTDNSSREDVFNGLFEDYEEDICSLLDAPVLSQGKLVGVVCVEQFYSPKDWTLEEEFFASSLADFMALAMTSVERYRTWEELALSKKRMETLMTNIPGMVYQCLNDPPHYTFTFVSEGSSALTGYSSDELLHNDVMKFLDMVHPEDLANLMTVNEGTLNVGLPLETSFRIVMKDGTVKWIWERSRVVEFKPDGTPHLLEGFYTDITEQRRLEAAEIANRTKSTFLANMSHEIRTPMNAVLGMADMAIRQKPSGEVLECLRNIKNAAGSLLSIINDILDFSKIETGALEIIPEPYYTESLIVDIVALINVRLGSKPIDFVVEDFHGMPRMLRGDSIRVKQALINLLTNALKFTNTGHIKLILRTIPTENENIVILKAEVEDTGIGIKREDMPLLFENFSQLDTKKNRNVEGTGLGLAITKRLLEQMGGSLAVESTYGKGSCFSFELPQTVEDPAPLVPEADYSVYKVGVWLNSSTRAESLIRKLAQIGVVAELVDSLDVLGNYSHVFMDYEYLQTIDVSTIPTMVFALSRNHFESREIRPNITVAYAPLTTIMLARHLTGAQFELNDGNVEAGFNLKVVGARMLVVDDNTINLLIAQSVLEEYGAHVDTALSGKEALEMLKDAHYDMVFMDHMMPEMDGVETAVHIRKMPQERFKNMPIVALTANAVGDVRSMFLKAGMNDYLSKPMVTKELERVLRQWLSADKCQVTGCP